MTKDYTNNTVTALALTLLLSMSMPAFADNSGSGNSENSAPGAGEPNHHHHHHHMKKVFEACAAANKISLPAKGSGAELSSGDRATLHACVKTFHENFQTCVQNAGISKPQPGTKPSAADKAAFKQCGDEALAKIKG